MIDPAKKIFRKFPKIAFLKNVLILPLDIYLIEFTQLTKKLFVNTFGFKMSKQIVPFFLSTIVNGKLRLTKIFRVSAKISF